MKILSAAVVLCLISTAGAMAQTAPSNPSPAAPRPNVATTPPASITSPSATTHAPSTSTAPPAVSTSNAESKTAAAPVPGANSFTESEARSRLESFGYTNVTGLQKDAQSVWRGTATKGGKSVGVALDYQGNIVTQ